jgi:hypothetical protein
MRGEFGTYAEFWPAYLRAHSRLGNRRLHAIGTGLGLLLLVGAAVTGDWRLLPAAVVLGYGFAWAGHFWVEGNRPATFGHPLWSLISDFRMLGLMLTGRLWRELDRFGIR